MSAVPPIAAHWIDGRPVEGEPAFDVAAAGGAGPELRRYPRAGEREVALVHEAAGRGGAVWSARPRAERTAVLARAAERLGDDAGEEAAGLWRALGARVGLDADELDRLRSRAADAAVAAARSPDGVRGDARGDARASGPLCLAPHWSELVEGAAEHAFAALARGAPIVLVPDARVPMAAELVALSLRDAGLDRGAAALLHDDVDRVVRALASLPHAVTLSVAAPAAELARRFAGPCVATARAREPAHPASGGAAPFGAGLGLDPAPLREAAGARWRPRTLASGTLVVGDDEAADEAARRVLAAALSRLPALSGQRPGQAGRVLVPERRLSAFTAALLAHLETDSDVARPVPPIDREEVRERRRARALGLDEGATLIWSGAPPTADRDLQNAADGPGGPPDGGGRARTEGLPSSRAEDGRASLMASVFTNVEPGGRLFALSRPLPLVRLVRVGDEAAGRRLAEALDAAQPIPSDPARAEATPRSTRNP